MNNLELKSYLAKRISKLSSERRKARKKLDTREVNYLNGRIDETRHLLSELYKGEK
jgi:hypothetical protein